MKRSAESFFFIFTLMLLVSSSDQLSAQITTKSHKINRQLSFQYDNDNYFGTDQYYSSGATVTYSRLISPEKRSYKRFSSKKSDSTKLIWVLEYGHRMFTPSDIKLKNEQLLTMDRPYAGWHYLSTSIKNYPSTRSMNSYKLTLGLIGEFSGIGNLHEWWHKSLGIKHPRGWDTEIANEVVANLRYDRLQVLKIYKGMDVITDSHLTAGNGLNELGQSAVLRWGKINPLSKTSFVGSRLSSIIPIVRNKDPYEEEGFVFYGWDASFVLSNIFIEGSLFNDNSPLIRDAESQVYTRKYGFMYSNYYTTFSLTVYKISREVVGGKQHRFINLQLAFRY